MTVHFTLMKLTVHSSLKLGKAFSNGDTYNSEIYESGS